MLFCDYFLWFVIVLQNEKDLNVAQFNYLNAKFCNNDTGVIAQVCV